MNILALDVPGEPPTASLCLQAERVEHTVVTLEDELAYGRALTEWWRRGEEFVVVEHDIAPWPGAISRLWECPLGVLCGHEYWHPQGGFDKSLGCTRFSRDLVQSLCPDAPTDWGSWAETPWRQLDGAVYGALARRGVFLRQSVDYRRDVMHVHRPGFAHARRTVRDNPG